MGVKKSTLHAGSESLAGVGFLLQTSNRRRGRAACAKECWHCCNSQWPYSNSPAPQQMPKQAL